MSIDQNLLIAAKLIHDECANNLSCFSCQLEEICNLAETPEDWEIPDPQPEPTERPRIEWLRMLPDDDAIKAINEGYQTCNHCNHLPNGTCLTPIEHEHCMSGYMDWWHEIVTLEQFRKDVGLV